MADEEVIIIKKKNFRNKSLRKARESVSDNEDNNEEDKSFSAKIEEMKIVQKLRERPRGVEIGSLGQPVEVSVVHSKDNSDVFKVKSGGMVNMKNVVVQPVDDAYDTGIGTQFSAETNKRDEDEEMMKYIEEELVKKKRQEKGSNETNESGEDNKYHSPEDAALLAVPETLRASSGQRSEEMLSHQMLSGIPEVDLGIECKIKNIEATEEAKLRLLWEQRNKKDGPSQFVPSNMAVNFAQANKDSEKKNKKDKMQTGAKRSSGTERATDDLHYEKFKKQFRRF